MPSKSIGMPGMNQTLSNLQNNGLVATDRSIANSFSEHFALPKRDVIIDPRSNIETIADTLASAYSKQTSPTYSKLFGDKLSDPWAQWYFQIMPAVWTDKLSFTYITERDQPAKADTTPHYAPVRRVVTIVTERHAELIRNGLGMEMELDRFLAKGGPEKYKRKMNQVVNGMHRSMYESFVVALLEAGLESQSKALLRPLQYSTGDITRAAKTRFCEGIFGDKHRSLHNLVMDHSRHMSKETGGIGPDFVIVGPRTYAAVVDSKPDAKVSVVTQDPATGQLISMESKEPVVPSAFPNNLKVYKDEGLTVGSYNSTPIEMFQNDASIVETSVQGPVHVMGKYTKDTERYRTAHCNISLSDMQKSGGGFKLMETLESLKQSMIWGDPKHIDSTNAVIGWNRNYSEVDEGGDDSDDEGDDYMPEGRPETNEKRYTNYNAMGRKKVTVPLNEKRKPAHFEYVVETTGDVRPIKTIGQIDLEHLKHESMALITEEITRGLYPNAHQHDRSIQGAMDYVSFMERVEGTTAKGDYSSYSKILYKMNAQKDVETAADGTVFPRLTRALDKVESFATNEFGGWDLPKYNENWSFSYPPFFNNPAGLVTFAEQGKEMKWPENAVALANRAVDWARDITSRLTEALAPSRAVKAAFAPAQFRQGRREMYALLGLLVKHRPALWASVTPIGDNESTQPHPDDEVHDNIPARRFMTNTIPSFYTASHSAAYKGPTIKVNTTSELDFEPFSLINPNNTKLIFPFIPFPVLEQVQEITVGPYGVAMSRMGGKSKVALDKIRAVLPDIEMPEFEKLLSFLGKRAGQDTEFTQLRAFVIKLASVTQTTVNNTTVTKLDNMKSLMKDTLSLSIKATTKDQRVSRMAKLKDLQTMEEDYIKSGARKDDKSRDNKLWIQAYSNEMRTWMNDKTNERAIGDIVTNIRLIMTAFNGIINNGVYVLPTPHLAAAVDNTGQQFAQFTNAGASVAALSKALKDTFDDFKYKKTESSPVDTPMRFSAHANVDSPPTSIGAPSRPTTIDSTVMPDKYGRTPLTFHRSMIKQLFTTPTGLTTYGLMNVPGTDYPIFIPSQPNTHDKQHMNITEDSMARQSKNLFNHPDYTPIKHNGKQSNVTVADVPGIRYAERFMNGNNATYKTPYSKAQHARFDEFCTIHSPLTRLISGAYALTSIEHFREVRKLCSKNIPIPIHTMPTFINIIQRCETMILGKSGPQMGSMMLSAANYAVGTNVRNKLVEGSLTCYFKGVVEEPNLVAALPNVMPVKIEGGAGVDFHKFPKYYGNPHQAHTSPIIREAGGTRPSLVVFSCSYEEAKIIDRTEDFDLIGRGVKERFANANDALERASFGYKNEFVLSAARFHEHIWNFRHIIAATDGRYGTYASKTYYGTYDFATRSIGVFHPSTSPRQYCFGAGAADYWNGKRDTVPMFNEAINRIPFA